MTKSHELSTHLHGNRLNEQAYMVNLVVGHKLDCGIRKDPNQSGRMALEKSQPSAFLVNFCTSTKRSAPSSGILLKVRIRGLEKDLDSV
jgi:hypothetical protein